jgi:glycosyltransferase involved in cell wall biosynthesis
MNVAQPEHVCVVIPAYREEIRVVDVVKAVKPRVGAVLVVDDGSGDGTAASAREAGAEVVVHPENRGKGAATETGFRWAREHGYAWVMTMDADGQHAAEDIAGFLDAQRESNAPAVIGNRMADPSGMPLVRRLTNRYMSWLLSRRMGQRVPDTQCGFRLYRTDIVAPITCSTARFDADSEILLALNARGVRMAAAPVRVIYGDEKSKIRPVRDTIRFFRMLKRFRRQGKHAGAEAAS